MNTIVSSPEVKNIVNNDYLYAVGAEGLLYKGNELIAQTGLNLF